MTKELMHLEPWEEYTTPDGKLGIMNFATEYVCTCSAENASRIIACVNSLAGIPTELLLMQEVEHVVWHPVGAKKDPSWLRPSGPDPYVYVDIVIKCWEPDVDKFVYTRLPDIAFHQQTGEFEPDWTSDYRIVAWAERCVPAYLQGEKVNVS